jgi:hypothetical protein
MVVVAIAALAFAGYRAKQMSDLSDGRAAHHAGWESYYRDLVAKIEASSVRQESAQQRYEGLANYHAALARIYRNAASRPLLPVEPEPPERNRPAERP